MRKGKPFRSSDFNLDCYCKADRAVCEHVFQWHILSWTIDKKRITFLYDFIIWFVVFSELFLGGNSTQTFKVTGCYVDPFFEMSDFSYFPVIFWVKQLSGPASMQSTFRKRTGWNVFSDPGFNPLSRPPYFSAFSVFFAITVVGCSSHRFDMFSATRPSCGKDGRICTTTSNQPRNAPSLTNGWLESTSFFLGWPIVQVLC